MANVLHQLSKNHVLAFTPEEMRKMLATGFGSEGVLASRKLPKVHSIKRRLGRETCDEIAERYEAGEHATALAKEYEIAASSVLVMLRARGVIIRAQAPTPEQIAKLVAGYNAGMTINELVERYGISRGTVGRALHAAGVHMRSRGARARGYDIRQL